MVSFDALKNRYRHGVEINLTNGILLFIEKYGYTYQLPISVDAFKDINFLSMHISRRINEFIILNRKLRTRPKA